ncbi:hypothetical protein CDL15_Pgr012068 [Punica granatum]|uniref:Uncharacterized protein n=1 Tax=Punica granatum TaxID=22663 RepID=A0A218XM18_PUNGR|nr:hypothetical protein CDL15_Pgr012068 [Punica granatum]PKI77497.1 hypothetical protein CRG98_002103 [Punica granatum]
MMKCSYVPFDISDVFPSLTWLHGISRLKPQFKKIHHEVEGILEIIINERLEARAQKTGKAEASEDLIDVLLKFEGCNDHGYSLSTSDIKGVVLDMFVGGGESSVNVVNWAVPEMMKSPNILERAQVEVGQERCEINGFEIPMKIIVFVNAWVKRRDPEYWKEPETFDPKRFLESPIAYKGNNLEYVPFGSGRRICPGMAFGLVSVELQLAMLLFRFDWKLPNGMKNGYLDMTESFGFATRRKDDLYLIPTPCSPFPS